MKREHERDCSYTSLSLLKVVWFGGKITIERIVTPFSV
jgi:hypothetical protein